MSFLNHRNRLEALAGIRHSIQVGTLDPILTPYFDGRVEEGDVRSPALRAALADLLAATDRVETQARADLTSLKSADRADTRNRERHERAEQGRQI